MQLLMYLFAEFYHPWIALWLLLVLQNLHHLWIFCFHSRYNTFACRLLSLPGFKIVHDRKCHWCEAVTNKSWSTFRKMSFAQMTIPSWRLGKRILKCIKATFRKRPAKLWYARWEIFNASLKRTKNVRTQRESGLDKNMSVCA